MLTTVEILGLGAMTIGLLALRGLALPWFVFLPVLIALTAIIQLNLVVTLSYQRRTLSDVYLRPDSSLSAKLQISDGIRRILLIPAILLAFITYIAIYGASVLEWIATWSGLTLAQILSNWLQPQLRNHLVKPFDEIYGRRFFLAIAVFLILAGIVTGTCLSSLWTDYSSTTARSNADLTIQDVKHGTMLVRHCVRTTHFFELELLRVRDLLGWPYGWAVFLFFLIPNAVPATGIVIIYSSVKSLIAKLEEQ